MKHPSLALSLLLGLLLPLAACNQKTAPTADAATADAPAAANGSPSPEAQAAAASAAAEAGAVSETAAGAAPTNIDTASEGPAQAAPAEVAAANPANGPALVEGKDYETIDNGKPYEPLNGKIEVVEVFGYVCPACARLEPLLTAWEQKLPSDVRFSYVPAPFGPQWIPYARAFYVADAYGLVDKTHTAMFRAIHLEQSLPGEGKTPDEQAVAAFYGKYGADPKQFLDAMSSFATEAKVKRGMQFMIRSGVSSTPTLVVDGKYRVLGKTYEDMLRITDQLIARERAAGSATAQ